MFLRINCDGEEQYLALDAIEWIGPAGDSFPDQTAIIVKYQQEDDDGDYSWYRASEPVSTIMMRIDRLTGGQLSKGQG